MVGSCPRGGKSGRACLPNWLYRSRSLSFCGGSFPGICEAEQTFPTLRSLPSEAGRKEERGLLRKSWPRLRARKLCHNCDCRQSTHFAVVRHRKTTGRPSFRPPVFMGNILAPVVYIACGYEMVLSKVRFFLSLSTHICLLVTNSPTNRSYPQLS